MAKKQTITEDTIIGAGEDTQSVEPAKEGIDGETIKVDTGEEIPTASLQAETPLPTGLNPGSGGEYRLEDGLIIPV